MPVWKWLDAFSAWSEKDENVSCRHEFMNASVSTPRQYLLCQELINQRLMRPTKLTTELLLSDRGGHAEHDGSVRHPHGALLSRRDPHHPRRPPLRCRRTPPPSLSCTPVLRYFMPVPSSSSSSSFALLLCSPACNLPTPLRLEKNHTQTPLVSLIHPVDGDACFGRKDRSSC